MAVDVKQYIDQLAQSAGLSPEEKDAILKVTGNEKFSKALGDDILRQQDYSRNMDALRSDKEKTTKYYADLLKWKADTEAELAQRLVEGTHSPVVQQVQPMEEFEKKLKVELDRREQTQISLLKDGMRLASQHVHEFKEPLDSDAVAKIAVERGMTLKQAYDEFVAPRRAELSKAQQEAAIAQAREEGAREYASKHKLPIDSQPREYHVMLDRDPSKQVGSTDYVPNSGRLSPLAERQLRDGFVDEWNKQPAVATSGT